MQAPQPRPDETHIVIERQPADEDIGRACVHDLTHGADVGKQVGVTEHHALWIAGAAGCVLDEGDGIGVAGLRQIDRRRRRINQMRNALDGIQAFHLRAQQSGQPHPLGHRDQQAGPGVAQNADLAPQMIFDLR